MTRDQVELTTRSSRPKRRPIAFTLHSLLGLYVSLFIGFVALTGTIATVSHELEWLAMPEVRADPAARADWGAMWDAARIRLPDGYPTRIATFDGTTARYFAREVMVRRADGRDVAAYVDPASNRVTAAYGGMAFHDVVRSLHYYLFLPGDVPFYAVTALGFILLASLITGLVTYRKFWRGFWKWPRFDRNIRTWAGDVHRLIGLWSLWFVVLVAVTSIWYLIEKAVPPRESPIPVTKTVMLAGPFEGVTINNWVATAQAAMPGLTVTAIEVPRFAGDPVIVEGQWQAWLVRARTNQVYIDPMRGRVLGQRVGERLSPLERWIHTADALHFGNFGGLWTKLIWVVFGLLLTAIAATGATIYAKRLRMALRPASVRA